MDFNFRYELINETDGGWIVRAFNSKNQPIGQEIHVRTRDEAWKIWCLLSGEPDEVTQEIQLRRVS